MLVKRRRCRPPGRCQGAPRGFGRETSSVQFHACPSRSRKTSTTLGSRRIRWTACGSIPASWARRWRSWRDTPATKRRDWGLAALVGLLSVAATVGILAAVGLFGSGSHSTNRASVGQRPARNGDAARLRRGRRRRGAAPAWSRSGSTSPLGEVQGSGVAVDGSRVLTSAALVGAGATVMVAAADGKPVENATVVGTDAETDLTLLKVDDTDLPAARLGHSDSLAGRRRRGGAGVERRRTITGPAAGSSAR